MESFEFACFKLNSLLRQVRELKTIEFPQTDSSSALISIEEYLLSLSEALNEALERDSDINVKTKACIEVNKKIAQILPILGHVLRSTNVRNAFEFYAPLLRISKILLGEDAKLLLSSEWDYAPFAYPQIYPFLRNSVLIGLPAFESSNALILPIAGHELGHLVWRKEKYKTQISPKLAPHIVDHIKNTWSVYEFLFDGLNKENLTTDLVAITTLDEILLVAIRQGEEIFCDLMGLWLFGESYLMAFQYIISPNFGEARNPFYPNLLTRSKYLTKTAQEFDVKYPDDYLSSFVIEYSLELSKKEKAMLDIADASIDKTYPDLVALVRQVMKDKIDQPQNDAARKVHDALKMILPAQGVAHLGEILVGGWKAHRDPDLWKDNEEALARRGEILNELLLKSIEVMEIELLTEQI